MLVPDKPSLRGSWRAVAANVPVDYQVTARREMFGAPWMRWWMTSSHVHCTLQPSQVAQRARVQYFQRNIPRAMFCFPFPSASQQMTWLSRRKVDKMVKQNLILGDITVMEMKASSLCSVFYEDKCNEWFASNLPPPDHLRRCWR